MFPHVRIVVERKDAGVLKYGYKTLYLQQFPGKTACNLPESSMSTSPTVTVDLAFTSLAQLKVTLRRFVYLIHRWDEDLEPHKTTVYEVTTPEKSVGKGSYSTDRESLYGHYKYGNASCDSSRVCRHFERPRGSEVRNKRSGNGRAHCELVRSPQLPPVQSFASSGISPCRLATTTTRLV